MAGRKRTRVAMEPHAMIRPKRRITGMSAILLPFDGFGTVDWESFERHVARTRDAGLVPAVNMDTGYVNLISPQTRREVLARTRSVMVDGRYVAGAFVADKPGDAWNPSGYQRAVAEVLAESGVPVIMQSHGLKGLPEERVVDAYQAITGESDEFIAFELGAMFAPFGRIYELGTYEKLMKLPNCSGAKHSSLSRELEWQRLALRDRLRPDFHVYTGNDLAIDMVMYGSDYLLGLSTMAPDLFAMRDKFWLEGDNRFYELNDLLQYMGMFTFRDPVPAYKHNAAQILKHQGWIASDQTAPGSPARPAADIEVLREIASRLQRWRQ
jgi:dihydrodipicolinate synthase/N-acetylneuraminate lyase